MSIYNVIERTKQLQTRTSLCEQWQSLGIKEGDRLLVHSSLSSLGYVVGGAVAVIESLIDGVGEQGTVVMPAQSTDLSNPALWGNPPVPEAWWPVIYKHMPDFRKDRTPTYGMGAIAELFRTYSGTLRSGHPHMSFCARGKDAERIVAGHEPCEGLGLGSPLGRLYELDARVLLVGVGYERCTSLHLAEYMADYPKKTVEKHSAPLHLEEGQMNWTEWSDLSLDTDDFNSLGAAFEAELPQEVVKKEVNGGMLKMMRMRPLVDFAVQWMEHHRV